MSLEKTNENSLYFASPLGFSEVGRLFMYEKIFPIIEGEGFTIIDPWTITPNSVTDPVFALPYGQEKREKLRQLNSLLGKNNTSGIDAAR